jgi:hypothetical protein
VALTGGTMTAGVVRVGDTVRRPVGRWTPAVHSLLRYLAVVQTLVAGVTAGPGGRRGQLPPAGPRTGHPHTV